MTNTDSDNTKWAAQAYALLKKKQEEKKQEKKLEEKKLEEQKLEEQKLEEQKLEEKKLEEKKAEEQTERNKEKPELIDSVKKKIFLNLLNLFKNQTWRI